MYTAHTLIRIINFVASLITIFLGVRFIFKLFGANPGAPFVEWLYDMTDPLLAPFTNIFPSPILEEGFIFEFSTIIAMVVYTLIAWIIVQFVALIAEQRAENRQRS